METLTNSGYVQTNGSTVLEHSNVEDNVIKSTLIKLNNPLAYTVTLKKLNSSTVKKSPEIFTFSLDAGDSVFDTTNYLLNKYESLFVTSSIPGTSFYVEAVII